ncbi:DUF6343 family protein [Peterkaempfera sp. SMS 1(5)a]|uniref:DUF6343 family protein n=1 Tax=Peterkaempfera podocarpi TaxID=3232308 RepID=UPI0036711FB9
MADRRTRASLVYGPYHPPERPHRRRRVRTGTEPRTALSDLRLRRTLSLLFAPLFLAGTIAFALLAADAGTGPAPNRDTYILFAAICAALTLVALVDLAVIARRMRARG